MEPEVVVARGLYKSFRTPAEEVPVLRGAELVVEQRDFVCITGASGSGKSTLLAILAGLEDSDAGDVCVLGHDVSGMSDRQRARLRLTSVGVVFQDHNLVPDFTASENIEVVLRAAGKDARTARSAATDSLTQVGIADLAERFPREVSGGQSQRVGIARALAGGKSLILADEPTGSLDRQNSESIFRLLADLAATGIAVVLCTHDPIATKFATRTLELRDGALEPTG